MTVFVWRSRIWGLPTGNVGKRLRICGLLCDSFWLEAEDVGAVKEQVLVTRRSLSTETPPQEHKP